MSALTGGLLLTLGQAGNAVTVSEVPLFISTGVTPNVMLMVDNSGSMNNIIWATEYDSTVEYPDWSPLIDHDGRNGTALREAWSSTDSGINHSTLVSCRYRGTVSASCAATNTAPTCGSGRVRGRNGAVTKCLTLPDPAGDGDTRYSGNYLNYLFQTYGVNTTPVDLSDGDIPNSTRMITARDVATTVVENNTNLRLGLSTFNTDDGGRILEYCAQDNTEALTDAIADLEAESWTPLAETLYEITRYFRGMTSFYNDGVDYTNQSPILYRCQKNFVILITDGYPTNDKEFPADGDDEDVGSASLPDFDGLSPATAQADYPNFPEYSDGFAPDGSATDEGHTLYLDDIAKFAYDTDLRKDADDALDVSFDDPTFPVQNLVTYTVGFAVANQMMDDAASYGGGLYLQANDEATLTIALQSALDDIAAKTSTAASVAANSTRLGSDTYVFQAKFSTDDWSGQLLALPIGSGGQVAEVGEDGIPTLGDKTGWNASLEMPAHGDRKIFTYDPTAALGSRGRSFTWDSLTAAQQALLNTAADGDTDALGEYRLNYVRGDQSQETTNGGALRARTGILGDIINSDPAFAGNQNYGFELLPGAEGTEYKAWRRSAAYKSIQSTVYVAANDGLLHAFDADDGSELFAYLPNAVYPKIRYLTDDSFNENHRLLNDGAPKVLDAYISGSWQKFLLGSLGGGGSGIYALNITDPEDFDTGDVMWEFTSADDSNMGVSIPQPTITRLNNDKWVALVANGYNSGGGPVLFIIDLATGAVIKEIATGGDTADGNGLSSPTPVDADGDRITDYVYAGDLKGNLWKFDLTSDTSSGWGVAFEVAGQPAPLYTACSGSTCTGDNYQPITGRPQVGVDPAAAFYIYFGTGQYFAVGDGDTDGTQTLYAIRDRHTKDSGTAVPPSAGRSNLQMQEVEYQNSAQEFSQEIDGVEVVTNVVGVRVTSTNAVAPTKDGWYLDLPDSGERLVSTPLLRDGKIVFTTLIPSGDQCAAGGESWLMILDALNGKGPDAPPLDLNQDRRFDNRDTVTITIDGQEVERYVSGVMFSVGATDNVVVTTEGGSDDGVSTQVVTGCGLTGDCESYEGPLGLERGRLSWREIQ